MTASASGLQMRGALVVAAALTLVGVPACSRARSESKVIDGAGASLPYPLYAKWSSEFSQINPSIRINYQPVGSGAGMKQLSDGVIDFGATDEPMSDAQLERSSSAVVHVPMTVGAVVVAYNVPGIPGLRLTPAIVADVFRGALTRWDDPRLRESNPNVSMPAEPITVVFRADGSGTSATFTTFLSRSSETWRAAVGAGVAPRFPVGVGARGNDGVAAYVSRTPFAIGYVELAHARQANLAVASIRNRAGNYVSPTLASLDRAVRSAMSKMPADLRLSIVDAEDAEAYPIAALSFLVLQRDSKTRAKAESLARFVWWGLHEGQSFAPALHYAPLPPEIISRAEQTVRGLRAEGKALGVPDGQTGG